MFCLHPSSCVQSVYSCICSNYDMHVGMYSKYAFVLYFKTSCSKVQSVLFYCIVGNVTCRLLNVYPNMFLVLVSFHLFFVFVFMKTDVC